MQAEDLGQEQRMAAAAAAHSTLLFDQQHTKLADELQGAFREQGVEVTTGMRLAVREALVQGSAFVRPADSCLPIGWPDNWTASLTARQNDLLQCHFQHRSHLAFVAANPNFYPKRRPNYRRKPKPNGP